MCAGFILGGKKRWKFPFAPTRHTGTLARVIAGIYSASFVYDIMFNHLCVAQPVGGLGIFFRSLMILQPTACVIHPKWPQAVIAAGGVELIMVDATRQLKNTRVLKTASRIKNIRCTNNNVNS